MTEHLQASVPHHLHAPDDVVALGDWQSPIERSMNMLRDDIRDLRIYIVFLSLLLVALGLGLASMAVAA